LTAEETLEKLEVNVFGSVALDVVTGMVLIYLLYSLLTTIIGEMISSWLGIRARVLQRAVERMLNDEPLPNKSKLTFKKVLGKIGGFFLHESKDFHHSFAGRFYNYPGVKYMAEKENRWFSPSRPSYLSREAFAQTLIHLFRGKGAGNTDLDKVDFCLKFNTLHIESQTLSYIRNLLADANGNLDSFIHGLQDWFEETMDRTTGWYKRKMRLVLFFVGLVVAISFNVDSISIATRLSKDKAARDQLVQMGIAASDTSSSIYHALRQTRDTTISDSLAKTGYRDVMQSINDANKILGAGWSGAGIGTVLSTAFTFWKPPFWGFILTALALSLGAPFWFNLLQKLVALRSAGVKPEEKESGGTTGEKESAAGPLLGGVLAAPTPVQAEAPVDAAMRIYGEEIRNESGVVGVVRGYCKTNGATQRCVQVNVVDSRSAVVLRSKYPRLTVADGQTVPMNVAVTGKPCLRNGVPSYFKNPDRAVANKSNVNGWGSAGCIVEDEFSSQKFLLSCFHVLNGSRRWDAIEGSKEIVANAAQTIANDYDGYLTQYLDVARALVTDDTAKVYLQKSPNPTCSKDVGPGDVFVTNVTISGARSGSITGTIVNDSLPYHFDYDISATEAISHEIDDLFAISHMDINGNVSSVTQEGDSGSLVVSDGNVLGMVVGGDSQYTYAMKMTRILSFLSVTLEVQV
jgi:hypothetical protein